MKGAKWKRYKGKIFAGVCCESERKTSGSQQRDIYQTVDVEGNGEEG
jgi:hypothetical protein